MENSMNSIASSYSHDEIITNDNNGDEDTTLEESSWTMYFEDFFATTNNNNNNIDDDQERSSFSLDDPNSSRIAGVVSSAAKKQDEEAVVGLPINKKYCKSLSFKRRRNRGANLVDEALEDTASSPVNSPKIYDLMDQFKKNLKQKDSMDISQERRSGSRQVNDERSNDHDHLGFIGQESDKTELKKRGLCLVPVSMVVNYLG